MNPRPLAETDDTKPAEAVREWTLGYARPFNEVPNSDDPPTDFICSVKGSFVSRGSNVDVVEKSALDRALARVAELEMGWRAAVDANNERDSLKAEVERLKDALNRIVGMVEHWTDEHGQRRTEEIYASKIARDALAGAKPANESTMDPERDERFGGR